MQFAECDLSVTPFSLKQIPANITTAAGGYIKKTCHKYLHFPGECGTIIARLSALFGRLISQCLCKIRTHTQKIHHSRNGLKI